MVVQHNISKVVPMELTRRLDPGYEEKRSYLAEHKFGSWPLFLFFSLSLKFIHLGISFGENSPGSMFEIFPLSDYFLPFALLSP